MLCSCSRRRCGTWKRLLKVFVPQSDELLVSVSDIMLVSGSDRARICAFELMWNEIEAEMKIDQHRFIWMIKMNDGLIHRGTRETVVCEVRTVSFNQAFTELILRSSYFLLL
jgi:hypothetical protein